MIYLQLFWSFVQVGTFSIGGGYAAMPLIQNQVVYLHPWLTMGQFTDLVTIAEMTPGPIALNSATFVGMQIGGFAGAVVATLGCTLPSVIIASILAFIYYRYQGVSVMRSILGSLRPAVVALIASAGLSILRQVALQGKPPAISNLNWLGLAIFCGAFFVLRKFKWNPIRVMLLCGAVRLGIGLLLG